MLRRDRTIVAVALFFVVIIAWAYTFWLAHDMNARMGGMADMKMSPEEMADMLPVLQPWTVADTGFMLLMWAVMMIGMMTPSAAPIILLYARVGRQAATQGQPFAATGWFAAGYLLAWLGFSVVATFAQWLLERAALLTSMMNSASNIFGGVVLIAAGIYQWTPLKYACLSQCQSPISFIQRHGGFSSTISGSLKLGAWHGAYCVGCCWALMALLFVGGVMNVLWIAVITIMVLLEKLLPGGRIFPRSAGLVLATAGMYLIAVKLL